MEVRLGLPQGQEKAAVGLYWEAFGAKLGKLLGPEQRGTAFFADSINPEAILAAMDGDTLLGIAAFKRGAHGFSRGGVRALVKHYGVFGTLWRVVPLAMLERKAPKDVLQMDGICVSATARGKGVGSALFQHLFDYAHESGCRAITLDVIDTNPRAKALYERLGFEVVSEEHTSIMEPLLGFSKAERMMRSL
ncbi:MAG: GNAT family N-acetyltransferase [Maritimibacter sp.]